MATNNPETTGSGSNASTSVDSATPGSDSPIEAEDQYLRAIAIDPASHAETSQRRLDSLVLFSVDPNEQKAMDRWIGRFRRFRADVVRCDADSTPTVEQICQFVFDVTDTLTGNGQLGALSHQYVDSGVRHIVRWSLFHFGDFVSERHELVMLGAMYVQPHREQILLDTSPGEVEPFFN